MAGSWLIAVGFAVLTLLLYLVGTYLVWMPRQCAVLAEVFAASGNFPSLVPRSVRGAILQMRLLGLMFLSAGLLIIRLAVTPQWHQILFAPTLSLPDPNWLIFPSLLTVLAGDIVLFDAAEWVAHTLDYWVDHPLVPRRMIPAFAGAFRLAGIALFLFGAGLFWIWLGAL